MTQTVIIQGEASRNIVHRLADRAPRGSVCKFDPPRRTNDQNAKLWAMLSDVSRAKPQGRNLPPELWKCLFMAFCGHNVRFEPSLDGEGVVPLGFKSSRLNKAEFSELIESILAFGAEHGVTFSDGVAA